MGYFSNFYVDSFSSQELKKFVILFNQTQVHNRKKYLLIVAQDTETLKIVRIIDFHGKKYDLYQFDEKWAKLKKGDVINLKCEFHKSLNCVNVLRAVADYELIKSFDYYNTIKEKCELSGVFSNDFGITFSDNKEDLILVPKKTDLEYLSKKLKGRCGFAFYPLLNCELIQYQTKKKNIKYQFVVKRCVNGISYADIVSYVNDIDIRIGDMYTGFALMEFKFQNDRLRLKVLDFINDDDCFKEPNDFNNSNCLDFSNLTDDDLPF